MESKTYTPKICNKEVELRKIRSVAIRAYCTDCSGGNRTEVKECPCTDCPLYPFRGCVAWNVETKKREYSKEQRIAFGERMVASRGANN